MPKVIIDWASILDSMEDKELGSRVRRNMLYAEVIKAFDDLASLDSKVAERLLASCAEDLKTDLLYSTSAIRVVKLILQKVQEGKCTPVPDLLPSALLIMEVGKKLIKEPHLRILTANTLLTYPADTFVSLATSHCVELIEFIEFYYLQQEYKPEGVYKFQVTKILSKILNALPLEKKLEFTRNGLNVWFKVVIPKLFELFFEEKDILNDNLVGLELLVDAIVPHDYADNPFWHSLYEDISNPKKYPLHLKKFMEIGKVDWHRIWIIFIKLLKEQITKLNGGVSPINALLPILELAFKLDIDCRCKAFLCWKVLIDNFSVENNEFLVNKRVKLLMIPLKLNNAKVPTTVLAKFDTWWYLIKKFHSKMEKFTDTVLMPFIQFCFGKSGTAKVSNSPAPGQMSSVTAKQCAEALIEIVGHYNCDSCVTVPGLNGKLISTKVLAEHWNDWVLTLCSTIKTLANSDSVHRIQQLTCLWKGFAVTIGELPENQIRADLVNELLKIAEDLVEESKSTDKLDDIVFNVLIISLFDDDPKIKQLLRSRHVKGPIYTILAIIQNPLLNRFYMRQDPETLVAKLKHITNFIMDDTLTNPDDVTEWLIKNPPANESKLLIWVALAESICESRHNLNHKNLCSVVLWPLKTMNSLSDTKSELACYKWYTLYSYVHPMTKDVGLDGNIAAILMGKSGFSPANTYFNFCASLALLKQKLLNDKYAECESESGILLNVMKNVEYKFVEKYLAVLIDTLVVLLNKVVENMDVKLAENSIRIVAIVCKVLFVHMLKTKNDVTELKLMDNTFKPIDALFRIEEYGFLKPMLAEALVECLPLIKKDYLTLKDSFKTVLNTIVSLIGDSDHLLCKNVTSAMNGLISNAEQDAKKSSFTAPQPKSAKKSMKKQPNIVNTVVEDGEEFVVVKSNWKFNPKKLTENQKEKLKRKREDIPALYQDLSQSQDEFKLTAWKTDSQEASNTTSSKSNSKTNEDFTDILKNMASTDIVPKIMENIITDTNKETEKATETFETSITKHKQSPAVKEPKTPRLPLKDRVFRNVRNLIEKSGLQTEDISRYITEELNQTVNENGLKTPVSVAKTNANVTNSAPPKISSERPTRAIKKPKKFEDTEIFAMKKKTRVPSSQDRESPDQIARTSKDQEVIKDNIEPNKAIISENVAQDSKELQNQSHGAQLIDSQPELSFKTKEFIENSGVVEKIDNSQALDSTGQMNIQSDMVEKKDDKGEAQQHTVSESTEDQHKLNETADNISEVTQETTPKLASKKKGPDECSTVKKKRSRIEKQLLIDMVEGHPVLQPQPEKRTTRKNLSKDAMTKRRKSLIEKSNKIKAELGVLDKKVKTKERSSKSPQQDSQPTTVDDSQEKVLESSEDAPMSEDIIESSQDSSITTISVGSATKKKTPIVCLDKANSLCKNKPTDTQKLLDDFNNDIIPITDSNSQSKDDIELSKNKTMMEEHAAVDLTEEMDTEPIDSSAVIIVNDVVPSPIVINTESSVSVGKETQEIAEADTLPTEDDMETISSTLDNDTATKGLNEDDKSQTDNDITNVTTPGELTLSLPTTAEILTDIIAESSNTGSPLKDDVQRKKDFLNNTIEISPIKSMSPIRDEKKSPSPETSSDYVVIKLTSPVQSNGEPFNEKCDSPEIFTEEKISPDKRDQSPPRKEVVTTNTSPSSSLSLKKNRPQMRSNGRAAQMLELCIPDTLQTMVGNDRSENEEIKKGSPLMNTPARRNLRILYNSVGDNPVDDAPPVDNVNNEESESFLKFKRALPTADSSPAGPILKRKLAEITDEATSSPACKRKRVSFHDPPVSTTVSVQKYIEPMGVRSPQSSTLKRQHAQSRPLTSRSPKRLDKVFRLETVLTKAVESFSDEPVSIDDTEISLDETPAVEIVRASELNDTDPICPELLDCKDPIDNIAGELSSYINKALLIKELVGKVETVADLAKMTELEVNRLCIKAPKVKVAKKVLTDYASKRAIKAQVNSVDKVVDIPKVLDVEKVNIEVQTNEVLTKSLETQTVSVAVTKDTQTDVVPTSHSCAQTDESGNKSTKDVIATCLVERPDFVDQLSTQLEPTAIRRIAEKLPFEDSLSLLLNKMDFTNTTEALNQMLAHSVKDSYLCGNVNLSVLQEHLCKRFVPKDLILFCSQLLHKIHDKPS